MAIFRNEAFMVTLMMRLTDHDVVWSGWPSSHVSFPGGDDRMLQAIFLGGRWNEMAQLALHQKICLNEHS